VAQRRYIPWGGDARTWIYKAPQYGFATGNEPKLGAIMVTREGSYYGHVAYIEAVNDPYVTISEMSLGRGIKTIRTLQKDDWRIIGYIY
jgi:surface antigen